MKRSVVITAFSGLAFAGFGLIAQNFNPALSAELNGFSINTQDKAVTITLFTDQRVPYTTEHQGKQYAIVLPNTQLSAEQLNNGLPVVIDNKNRFIGRAVPTDDGKVKIILPNLPANDYAVSVQQKHGASDTVTVAEAAPSIRPRPAVSPTNSNRLEASRFEKVAASFPKPHSSPDNTVGNATEPSNHLALKLSPSPSNAAIGQAAGNGSIWNPYVVKVPAVPSTGSSPYSHYHPVAAVPHRMPPANAESPITTLSVADSLKAGLPATQAQPSGGQDPLWYLHALPPASASSLPPVDSLAGTAKQPASATAAQANPAERANPMAPPHSLSSGMQDIIASIPKWLLITLALFLGGIGVFTLIGGLVLLRILFSQTRQQLMPQPITAYPTTATPLYASMPDTKAGLAGGLTKVSSAKSPYGSKPGLPQVVFQDKASFNALDYLRKNPGNVRQAVHNATLLKFPNGKRQRNGAKKPASRQIGSTPVYSYNP